MRLLSAEFLSAAIRSAALSDDYIHFSPNLKQKPCVQGEFIRNIGAKIWGSPSKDVELLKLLITSSGGFVGDANLAAFTVTDGPSNSCGEHCSVTVRIFGDCIMN